MSSLAQLLYCTYAIPITVPLQGLAYAYTSITYYILHNIQVRGTLSWVCYPLVASPTERDQHSDLCVAPGGDSWHIPYFPQKSRWVKYHCYQLSVSQTSMVTPEVWPCPHQDPGIPPTYTTTCDRQTTRPWLCHWWPESGWLGPALQVTSRPPCPTP